MPLVHFFETSFGRTTERHMVLVEVSSGRRFRLGRGHGGRESVLQRGVDRIGLADPARLRCAARAASQLCERGRSGRAHARTSAGTTDGARRTGSRGVGSGSAHARTSRCTSTSAAGRGARFRAAFRSASRIRCRSFSQKIETELAAGYQRIKMKIKPGWDVEVVREVRQAISRHSADGRRQFGLHAGRRAAAQVPGRIQPDDDRAAARARRDHRSRQAAGAT